MPFPTTADITLTDTRQRGTAGNHVGMATDNERSPRPRGFPGALRTTVRSNSSAYGYSLAITVAFGLVAAVHGSPSTLETFVFLIGATGGFVSIEAAASRGFRRPSPPREQEQVVVMSGAMDVFAVLAAAGAATGAARTPAPTVAWALGGFLATTTFLLVGGVDILLAREAGESPSSPPDE